MLLLILGLLLFLGVHSTRIVADDWRQRTLSRVGEKTWKGAYSVVSAVGLVAIVIGYGLARRDPTVLWTPLPAMRHVAGLLTLVSFVLIAAAYVPRNHLKAALGHPMLLGVKVWALAHLLANHTLADLLLFGGFLLWAVLAYRAARARDRAAGTTWPRGEAARSAITVLVGGIAWAAFAIWGHTWLIGVPPM